MLAAWISRFYVSVFQKCTAAAAAAALHPQRRFRTFRDHGSLSLDVFYVSKFFSKFFSSFATRKSLTSTEFFDQNFIEFLVYFFTRAEIWLHSTSSRRKNSKTRWYGLFWAGRSWRFSGSEKEKFFEKKFGHVKNIEKKRFRLSAVPGEVIRVVLSSSSSSSSSRLFKKGNV